MKAMAERRPCYVPATELNYFSASFPFWCISGHCGASDFERGRWRSRQLAALRIEQHHPQLMNPGVQGRQGDAQRIDRLCRHRTLVDLINPGKARNAPRSEERRVGKECVSTRNSQGA